MLTGRLGYAIQPASLLYVKGGGIFTKENVNTAQIGVAMTNTTSHRTGWVLGTGIEFAAAPNWSWFVEYNYADLGTHRNLVMSIAPFDYSHKLQTVMFGVNYRFGGR